MQALTNLLPPQARWRAPVIVAGDERDAQACGELADLLEAAATQIRSLDPAVVLREAGFPIRMRTEPRKKAGRRSK